MSHSSTAGEYEEYVRWLEQELDRLKAGKLTEEEIQALCHEQGEDCPLRFARGCVDYNRRLFGDRSLLKVIAPGEGRGAIGER